MSNEARKQGPPSRRFGIGEWYGHLLPALNVTERKALSLRSANGERIPCPFKPLLNGEKQFCNKKGGVCSLKMYESTEGGASVPVSGKDGALRILCPSRFLEAQLIETWIGQKLLETAEPLSVGEVGFLRAESYAQVTEGTDPEADEPENVGRIDSVLMHPNLDRFEWCAVELQAVYFSGSEMGSELKLAGTWEGDGPPFPVKNRRPDYRSSGPKRLMPQLQIKVPTLRRWGKKMAVVVDESFFGALGTMDHLKEPSNADIAWFVVRLTEAGKVAKLELAEVRFTTLERAVEGLTAGRPVSLPEFERRIKQKLQERQKKLGQTPLNRATTDRD